MPGNSHHTDIGILSMAEKIDLMAALWDNLLPITEESALTEAQALEIRRRVALLDSGQMPTYPWHEVRERLKNRK